MGVFVPISPFTDISISSFFVFSSKEQLFLLGGIAIAVGVFTYSKRVMFTVGNDLLKMSPVAAFIVVISHSIVLFLFASQGISNFLQSINLTVYSTSSCFKFTSCCWCCHWNWFIKRWKRSTVGYSR
jgi:PiT family inorganic phosphate transporter